MTASHSLLANLVSLVGYVVLSIGGLTIIKSAESFFSVRMGWGFFAYGLGFGIWILLLRSMPLSVAFPIAAGALIIGSQVSGWWLLKEPVSMLNLVGVGLVLAGIILIYLKINLD